MPNPKDCLMEPDFVGILGITQVLHEPTYDTTNGPVWLIARLTNEAMVCFYGNDYQKALMRIYAHLDKLNDNLYY